MFSSNHRLGRNLHVGSLAICSIEVGAGNSTCQDRSVICLSFLLPPLTLCLFPYIIAVPLRTLLASRTRLETKAASFTYPQQALADFGLAIQ